MHITSILIVSGYSGAGKSTVLRTLEDAGFFCIDNLPLGLLDSFFQFVVQSSRACPKIALGLDIRAGGVITELVERLQEHAQAKQYTVRRVFLTASTPVLLKRFQETRRKHPLAQTCDLTEALEAERNLLKPLLQYADTVIDTDQLTMHDLRDVVRRVLIADSKPRMLVSLLSFGFKYGVPQESNFVYDVRALPNPYFLPELKLLDGTMAPVRDYLFGHPYVQEYWSKLHDFITYTLEQSYKEGRAFVHVAIGCTGGRHRSVAFVQELANTPNDVIHFLVKHRDITKDTLL